jgi:hypothetical protein
VVDRSLARRRARSLAATIGRVIELASQPSAVDSLPDLGTDNERYAFDAHVRGVAALQEDSSHRVAHDSRSTMADSGRPPASRPMAIPGAAPSSTVHYRRQTAPLPAAPMTDSAEQDWLELHQRLTGRPAAQQQSARSPTGGSPGSPTRAWWNSLRWSSGSGSGGGPNSGSWSESIKTLREVLQNTPTASGAEAL